MYLNTSIDTAKHIIAQLSRAIDLIEASGNNPDSLIDKNDLYAYTSAAFVKDDSRNEVVKLKFRVSVNG